MTTSKPWEQQINEPDAAYARFLVYRNLGPNRSVDAAYSSTVEKSRKSQSVSGQWASDCASYGWVKRAQAWDIYNLDTVGRDVVINFFETLRKISEANLEALSTVKPRDWSDVVSTLQMLSAYVTPESVEAIRSSSSGDSTTEN